MRRSRAKDKFGCTAPIAEKRVPPSNNYCIHHVIGHSEASLLFSPNLYFSFNLGLKLRNGS
jgi:hypothetical protein